MIRVLLADDHPMIQTAVASLLEGTSYQIAATARSGAEAIGCIAAADPDLVLLDVQMPDGSGLDVLRRLRRGGDSRPIVLLTAAIDDRALAEAVALDVNGIVLKDADPARLLDCLDAVTSGRSWIDPDLKRRARDFQRRSSAARGLTPRERELIGLVRKGLKNREIAAELGVTEGTVKVYLHRLFEKLGVGNRTELAMSADLHLASRPHRHRGET